jgi:bifunctional non-homologous end joining protein LigD
MARSVTTRSETASLAHTTGAKRTRFPAFIKPCLAKLHGAPPEGDAWTHEEKIDGYRLEAHLRSERATLYTRKRFDWTHKFSTIARALQTLTAEAAVFDGEVAVFDSRGISDFHALQADLAAGRTDRLMSWFRWINR